MSNNYKHGDRVPTQTLADRLHELGVVVTKGRDAVRWEFTMSIPAELDRDADLVLTESARRLKELQAKLSALRSEVEDLRQDRKRLELLIDRECFVSRLPDGSCYVADVAGLCEYPQRSTAREAIDEAMRHGDQPKA